MKNLITQFSRLFVGILFIISGLIKLNDPIGFSYKLAEYFSEPVFNMPFFVPFSLGYGEKGAGNGAIPGFATMIFEVELLGIKHK